MLKVLRPGMFTTVQDEGRWGYQQFGLPVSGAMDLYSHRLANCLAGNRSGAATLEVTLIGPRLEFAMPARFAVTGADFALSVNGRPVRMNRSIDANAGDVLAFGERSRGARAYVAIAGGIDVPLVLGSRATHALTRTGGFQGRALRAGDELPIHASDSASAVSSMRVPDALPLPAGGARLRILGDDSDLASVLTSRRFHISPQSDRMGYRLIAQNPAQASTGELISFAVPSGAVQVPPRGEPILLMMDHATAGGYAVPATVITADLPIAGQLAPGDWIEFEQVALEQADAALDEREAGFA